MTLDNITLKYDEHGLIPAIVQDQATRSVLMLAYMNQEALTKTIDTGRTWFYSRSRQCLWPKGETSGNIQTVTAIYYDCDADTLLIQVDQTGCACHEGTYSCFSRQLYGANDHSSQQTAAVVLQELYEVILNRKAHPQADSYTNYLFNSGQDKILKKIGEEAAETIIASKNHSKSETVYEMADLWYHCLVLLGYHNITPAELLSELQCRRR